MCIRGFFRECSLFSSRPRSRHCLQLPHRSHGRHKTRHPPKQADLRTKRNHHPRGCPAMITVQLPHNILAGDHAALGAGVFSRCFNDPLGFVQFPTPGRHFRNQFFRHPPLDQFFSRPAMGFENLRCVVDYVRQRLGRIRLGKRLLHFNCFFVSSFAPWRLRARLLFKRTFYPQTTQNTVQYNTCRMKMICRFWFMRMSW